jgi:drug/metabolite transporter, DME family
VAAALNGTIGTFTKLGFSASATHHEIAFLKCFAAFVVLLAFCLGSAARRRELASNAVRWPQFALLSFLGIFCLYFFETWAFAQASVPLVSFLTYAAGGFTLLLSSLFLGERLGLSKLGAFAAIIGGVYLIVAFEGVIPGRAAGIVLALLGGLGYAMFIFMSKLFRMQGGLPQLVWLFGFGSLYLAVPLLGSGLTVPSGFALLMVAALVVFPTIGGFYFTTKALEHGEASKVQIVETGDPLFATLFGFLFLGESLGMGGSLGAACIMAGLLLAIKPDSPRPRSLQA